MGQRRLLVASGDPGFSAARTSFVTVVFVDIGFVTTAALFWAYGFLAYYRNFGGFARFAGAFFLPILALPVVGQGQLGGHDVRSVLWLAWFVLEIALGFGVLLAHLARRLVDVTSRRPAGPTPETSGTCHLVARLDGRTRGAPALPQG